MLFIAIYGLVAGAREPGNGDSLCEFGDDSIAREVVANLASEAHVVKKRDDEGDREENSGNDL